MSNDPILSAQNLSKTFWIKPAFGAMRTIEALRDVSFDLYPGRALALVGESGSGKSTVGRCLVGQFELTSGRITLEGESVFGDRSRRMRRNLLRQIQMVFQDPFSALNPTHVIKHQLSRPLRLHQPDVPVKEALNDLLDGVGLEPTKTLDKFPHELSGGQRQRISFARALAVNAKVIVADEPTSMLDVSVRKSVLGLIQKLKEKHQLAILYITHDIATAQYLAEDTMVMFAGQVVEKGPTAKVIGAPRHGYTQLLRRSVPVPSVRLTATEPADVQSASQTRDHARAPIARMVDAGGGHFFAEHA